MSAITKPPAIRRPSIAGSAKGKPLRKPNKVRLISERRDREAAAQAAAAKAVSATPIPRGNSQCPNKACPNPNVVDGTCQTCGRVADESNIVSEITFGETSSGAAIVQGSYLGADQGGVRINAGQAFRRVAGNGPGEARERSLREAKDIMNGLARRLNIPPSVVDSGHRLYRLASLNNFVQGRRIHNIVAMCLFSACRKEGIYKVMLIDLADLLKEDVFRLGRNYKAFQMKFPEQRDTPAPPILEDLIFRFASKLEFYEENNKIALSAVRIAKRMQADHMTHGRRPAGICGAAVIMAARAHSYRRTVREVVYIAKVTEHTLQQRLDEFANVPSAQMTIEDFHHQEFLESQSDPPAWYKQTPEWKEKHQSKKRKVQEVEGEGTPESSTPGAAGDKRQKTAEAQDATQSPSNATPASGDGTTAAPVPIDPRMLSPSSTPPPEQAQSKPQPNTDKDGFVIPPIPAKPTPAPEHIVGGEERAAIVAARGGDGELNMLAEEFGDEDDAFPERSTEAAMAAAQGIIIPGLTGQKAAGPSSKAKGKGKAKAPADRGNSLAFDEDWRADEAAIEKDVEDLLHDKQLMSLAVDEVRKEQGDKEATLLEEFAHEQQVDQQQIAALQATIAQQPPPGPVTLYDTTASNPLPTPASWTPGSAPPSKVKEDPIVTEDEFADDPEVQGCLLEPHEAAIKAQIWTNENEDWMRAKQRKEHEKKKAARGPAKKTRNRQKTARMGEGQASPASSAGEAAAAQLNYRKVSTKLNQHVQEKIEQMFSKGKGDYHRTNSVYGDGSTVGTNSAAVSRAGSEAPSEVGSHVEERVVTPATSATFARSDRNKENVPQPTPAPATNKGDDTVMEDAEEEEGDEEDYNQTGYEEEQEEFPDEIDPFAEGNGGQDEDEW